MREKDKERDKSKKNTDEKIEIRKEKDFIISALAAVVSVTFITRDEKIQNPTNIAIECVTIK